MNWNELFSNSGFTSVVSVGVTSLIGIILFILNYRFDIIKTNRASYTTMAVEAINRTYRMVIDFEIYYQGLFHDPRVLAWWHMDGRGHIAPITDDIIINRTKEFDASIDGIDKHIALHSLILGRDIHRAWIDCYFSIRSFRGVITENGAHIASEEISLQLNQFKDVCSATMSKLLAGADIKHVKTQEIDAIRQSAGAKINKKYGRGQN